MSIRLGDGVPGARGFNHLVAVDALPAPATVPASLRRLILSDGGEAVLGGSQRLEKSQAADDRLHQRHSRRRWTA